MSTISISLKDLLNVASATQISFTLIGVDFDFAGKIKFLKTSKI